MAKKDFDVIIIGGGPAGISAALWCDELNLKALLLESRAELGGQLLSTYNPIENYLGFEAKKGRELRDRFVDQISKRNFTLRLNSEVVNIDFEAKNITLANGDIFSADGLIFATGVSRRKLDIEGEKEFIGKGILESGKRDKNLVKDKKVLIIGGGDAAFENTEILSDTASEIILVHRRDEFTARTEFIDKALGNKQVRVITNAVVEKISGDENVTNVSIKSSSNNEIVKLEIDAILIRIGVEPNTQVLKGKVSLDSKGYVKIDQYCETNVSGVFAVGDVANSLAPTVSSAVGMGATAVKSFYSKNIQDM